MTLRHPSQNGNTTALFILAVLFFFISPHGVRASYDVYAPGDTVTLGDFVYNDDMSTTTTDNCTITVYDPTGTLIADAQTPTADFYSGWHHYTLPSPVTTKGIWPAWFQCGTAGAGDLIKEDLSFTVSDYAVSSSTVATLVNAHTDLASTSIGSMIANASTSLALNTNASVLAASTSIGSMISNASSSLSLNTNASVFAASTSIGSMIANASTSLAASIMSIPFNVWNFATSTMTAAGTIGKHLVATLDAAVSSIVSGGGASVADIWSYATRTLTGAGLTAGSLATLSDLTTATSSVAAVVNGNTNASVLAASSSIGSMVVNASTSLAVSIPTNVWNATTRSLTTFGTLVADIWTNGTRTLTGAGLSSGQLAVQSDVTTASSSLAAVINANTNTQTSGVTSAVNANTNATVLAASSSLATSIPTNVWNYTTRTLTSLGSLVADVWGATTRTLTSLTLSSQSPWTVSMSDFGTVSAGGTYRTTVTTIYSGTLTDSANLPLITIYDPSRNVIVNAAPMTRTSVGTYEYAYVTSGSAPGGVWESNITATVETGKTLPGNDYWNVSTSPPQVIINSVNGTTVPNISANATITNEGLAGYEYLYQWCVVTDIHNACGGGDDVFYASAAKYINPGENFNTTLTATVPNPGNYYFKVVAFFGTESSGASRSFTAVANNSGNNNGGGNLGGNNSIPAQPATALLGSFKSADLNRDGFVNSIDFSILLAFWNTKPPFKNKYVDINKDTRVNSIDFSIMLYQWDKK